MHCSTQRLRHSQLPKMSCSSSNNSLSSIVISYKWIHFIFTFSLAPVQLPTYPGRPQSASQSCRSRKCWQRHRGWCCGDWCRRYSASEAVSERTQCRQSLPPAVLAERQSLPGLMYAGWSSWHHCLGQSMAHICHTSLLSSFSTVSNAVSRSLTAQHHTRGHFMIFWKN